MCCQQPALLEAGTCCQAGGGIRLLFHLPWLQQQRERQGMNREPWRHFAIKWCNLVSARCFDFAQLSLCAFRLILLAGRSRAACRLSSVLV